MKHILALVLALSTNFSFAQNWKLIDTTAEAAYTTPAIKDLVGKYSFLFMGTGRTDAMSRVAVEIQIFQYIANSICSGGDFRNWHQAYGVSICRFNSTDGEVCEYRKPVLPVSEEDPCAE